MASLLDQQYAESVSLLETLLERLSLIEMGPAVKQRAASPFPTVIGTLDAIHLATSSHKIRNVVCNPIPKGPRRFSRDLLHRGRNERRLPDRRPGIQQYVHDRRKTYLVATSGS